MSPLSPWTSQRVQGLVRSDQVFFTFFLFFFFSGCSRSGLNQNTWELCWLRDQEDRAQQGTQFNVQV